MLHEKNIYFEIENDFGKYRVPISYIRYDCLGEMSLAEKDYWFNFNEKQYKYKKLFKHFKFVLYIQ